MKNQLKNRLAEIAQILILIIFAILIGLALNHTLKRNITEKIEKSNEIIFIWNDDEESIPMDGELIRIEYTNENTVYIGPAN